MHTTARHTRTAQEQPESTPAPAPLGLEARMAAVDAAMTVRLELAALAVDVNSAHILTTPIDLTDIVRVPDAIPQTPVDLYPTPVAALMQRAHQRLTRDGWCAGATRAPNGARCLYGAIHAEAGGDRDLETQALQILLEAIRRRFPDAESVPVFNDHWNGPHMPLLLMGQAADLAHARGM